MRHYQKRYAQGVAALGREEGWRCGRRRISGKRLRSIETRGSNRAIAHRLGVSEKAIRKPVGPSKPEGDCRLHGGAKGSGGPPSERNGQYRHGERTKAAIAEQRKFSALLKMLRNGVT